MAVSQGFFIKAALPVVGLCILLSLAIAANFEPKKDYSRRIFLSMNAGPASELSEEAFWNARMRAYSSFHF